MVTTRMEVVRRACRAWGEHDLGTIRELYASDVIADGGELWPEGQGPVRGVDAVLATFETIMSAFEQSELVPEAFLEEGDTLVVPLLWRGCTGGVAGMVEQRLVGTYGFRGELLAENRWFASLESALEALGLWPESAARLQPDSAEAH